VPIFDDFNSKSEWKGPLYGGGTPQGAGEGIVASSSVLVTHHPRVSSGLTALNMEKEYLLDFQPNTWVHFRFRMREPLIGADMYTHIYVDDLLFIQVGINGEQHWEGFQNCVAKKFDDQCFFSTPIIKGTEDGNNNDLRIEFADNIQAKYSDWMLFSVKYEVADGVDRRLRILINGHEVKYRVLDAPFPQGSIDMRTNWVPKSGLNKVKISFGILCDGDSYSDTSNIDGVRYRRCYAAHSPARPTYLAHPQNLDKLDWMSRYDSVKVLGSDQDRIWQGIFGGTVDLDTAVLINGSYSTSSARSYSMEICSSWSTRDFGETLARTAYGHF
jgi:hypothetical protein